MRTYKVSNGLSFQSLLLVIYQQSITKVFWLCYLLNAKKLTAFFPNTNLRWYQVYKNSSYSSRKSNKWIHHDEHTITEVNTRLDFKGRGNEYLYSSPPLACGHPQPYLWENPIKVIRAIYIQQSEILVDKYLWLEQSLFCVCKALGMQILKCFPSCNKAKTYKKYTCFNNLIRKPNSLYKTFRTNSWGKCNQNVCS